MRQAPLCRPPAPCIECAFFLDVDGTLLDIADTPSAVRVDRELLELIGRLFRISGGAVALVSGRSISDLEELLGMRRLPLAGQHGLERRDSAGRLWIHAAPPGAKCAIKDALLPVLNRHPGLLLEDKGLTLALHYRQAPHLAAYAHRLMDRLMREVSVLNKATLTPTEAFYYAALLHLEFVKIHPFNDGNGRTGRLLEKWFLAKHVGPAAWLVNSELYYRNHLQQYYDALRRLGPDWATLDMDQCIPFLLLLPKGLRQK